MNQVLYEIKPQNRDWQNLLFGIMIPIPINQLTLTYAGGAQGPPYHTFAHSAQNNISVSPGTS